MGLCGRQTVSNHLNYDTGEIIKKNTNLRTGQLYFGARSTLELIYFTFQRPSIKRVRFHRLHGSKDKESAKFLRVMGSIQSFSLLSNRELILTDLIPHVL
jgi:hypothetical protein